MVDEKARRANLNEQANQSKQVIVTGATSVIGRPVLTQLRAAGHRILEVSRQSYASDNAVLKWDLQSSTSDWQQSIKQALTTTEDSVDSHSVHHTDHHISLVHCAPIWLLAQHLEALIEVGVQRVLVFSSSSIDGKADSASASEQNIVQLLTQAEQQVTQLCQRHQVALSIFRPTMIYGYGQGQNLSFIARVVKRFGIFVVASPASGLRQPVHADDLAQAVRQALYAPITYGRTYTLSGAEVMSYKELVQRIFSVLGQRPRIICLPVPMYRLGLRSLSRLASLFGKSLPIDPAMADRMQQNLNFSHQQAAQDFAYKPGEFLPNAAADLLLDVADNNAPVVK